jgi:putative hydrolase of the HAD superfamily
MAKVIAFDLDDTLYKEIDFLKSAYRTIADKLRERGVEDAYPRMLEWYADKQNVFQKINEYYHLDIPMEDYLQVYRYHVPTISLSEGATELLNAIVDSGNRVALITDGRSKTQRNKVEALGLLQYLSAEDVIVSEELGSEKPDVRNYNALVSKYPSDTFVYVADNTRKDFVTPNTLGWSTIGLLDDGRNIHPQDFNTGKEFQPKVWVKSLKEVINIIVYNEK